MLDFIIEALSEIADFFITFWADKFIDKHTSK